MPSETRDNPRPTSSRRFVRRLLLRGVMGLLLIAISYEVITIDFMYRSHLRERQFMRRLEERGGRATYQIFGPEWIPLSIRGRYWAFLHVSYVDLAGADGALDFLPELKTLNWLESLSLAEIPVQDADLQLLEQMPRLQDIRLWGAKVTDAGLVHLHGLSNLKNLDLGETRTTSAGRNRLRRRLPNCAIVPDP